MPTAIECVAFVRFQRLEQIHFAPIGTLPDQLMLHVIIGEKFARVLAVTAGKFSCDWPRDQPLNSARCFS
jgi:hypothetical protein